MAERQHTKDRLADALLEAGLPTMADKARTGYYDDYLSPHADNMAVLLNDLMDAGTVAAISLRMRVINGDFDGTTEESEAWAKSPEGQAAFRSLMRGGKKGKPK